MAQERKIIAVSGDAGSFSEEAGLLYASREALEPQLVYAIDMEGVLAAVDNGHCDLGIFPVVNSRGGLVQTAFEAMGRHSFRLVGELWLEVQQCLLARRGVLRAEIKKIASHPQAISQCERYLAREFLGIALEEWEDTAKAARDLSTGVLDPSAAVIAPARSAALYDLDILERGIQDSRPNLTTFIIVTRA
ncbi:MAG: prephenate dehydratase domain-containing protein [Patescibacteria group bacterium]